MTELEKLLWSSMDSDERFRANLREMIDQRLGMSIQEFSRRASIPQSTLYKILSEGREPSLKTLRQIINTIREIQGRKAGNFIGLIATRSVPNEIIERTMQLEDRTVNVREYPAGSVEDTIIAAIKAERDGAVAIVCPPIVTHTVEKLLNIPITPIQPRESVTEALRLAARRSLRPPTSPGMSAT